MAIDAFGKEINIGDTVIVARTHGRSCALAAGIVTRIDEARLYYEVVMDKGHTEKSTDYGISRFVGDICYVLPQRNSKKYDKIIDVGYGFDHDNDGNVIGDLFVR